MSTNLTASIAGVVYPVINKSYTLSAKIDERTTASFTIFDANASYIFQAYQPVTITDTLEGLKFSGFIQSATVTKYDANISLAYQINCIDNHFLADKRTTNRAYTNQYAGVIAAGMINDNLAVDGVLANYALRDDNTQSGFAQGTLSGTIATSNLGGDLELTPAGKQVIYSNPNGIMSGSSPVIKFVGTSSQGYNNNYHYHAIYNNSISIGSTDTIFYDVWIQSNCPEIKCAVDVVCTDGTTWRDNSSGNTDAQGIGPHPNNDLSGFADQNAWYHRQIGLGSSLNGKTLAYVSIAFEGDTKGLYTAYFRNIAWYTIVSGNYQLQNHIFDNTQNTLQANYNLQSRGYSNISLSVLNGYDNIINYVVDTASIGAANIVKSSYMSWILQNTAAGASNALAQSQINSSQSTLAATVQTSIDNGASWQTIQNNTSIPNLQPGMVVSSRSIQYRVTLLLGIDPTVAPIFSIFNILVNPSYSSSKTDSISTATASADFNAGTYSNTKSAGSNGVTINGFTRNWDDTNYSNQTLFGNTAPNQFIYQKTFKLTTSANTDAKSRMDFVGQWQNITDMEVDVQVSTNYAIGLVYRTTNWGNNNDTYAYSATVGLTSVLLGRGTNSTGSGGFTSISNNTSISLAEGSWHRLKVVVSGSTHTVYVDGAQYINASDGTYSAQGNVGLRIYTSTGSQQTGAFDNFGIVASNSGQWTSGSVSLASLGNYGTSMVEWDTSSIPSTCTVTAQTSVDNSSTYQPVTNGGTIPNLTVGQSLSGKNLQFQLLLNCGDATAIPIVNGITAWVQGQYSSTGTRVAPVLQLTPAQIAGSTVVNWTATTPNNTSVTVATSTDGTNYTNVTNGGSISGITTQPVATLDSFSSGSLSNYTNTFRSGGSMGNWFCDVLNSRITITSGTNAMLLYNAISVSDMDTVIDLDISDCAGLVWRETDTSDFYELDIFDASSNAGSTNNMKLYKVSSNTKTQLGSTTTISFTRGNVHRVRVTMIGTAITVYFDGVNLISLTDSTLAGPGKIGLIQVSGSARIYNLRMQPQGQSVATSNAYTKVTLSSSDPTVTPQLTDLVLACLHPNIGLGSLVPTASYIYTSIASNLDDLAKKSGTYYWLFDQNLNFIFSDRLATPSPWIIGSYDPSMRLSANVVYANDVYRNRYTCTGVQATGLFSENKVGDGKSNSWTLAYPIIAAPSITVNGVLQTVGIKNIDTGKQFYWQLNNNTIDQDPSGTILQLTDTLGISYTGADTTTVSVDNTNLINTLTQKGFAQITGKTTGAATLLNLASAAQGSKSLGDFNVSIYRDIIIDINITAFAGSSPTVTFFVDRKGSDGNYYNIWQSATISATGQLSLTIGPGGSTAQSLGSTIQFRWNIGGSSTPTATFSASIIGRYTQQSANLGIVEIVEDVTSQNLNIASAQTYCTNMLARYGSMGRTLTCTFTRTNPSLSVGQYVSVFIPEINVNDATMLVTQIDTTQDITVDSNGNPTQFYFAAITATENANLASPWKLLASTVK